MTSSTHNQQMMPTSLIVDRPRARHGLVSVYYYQGSQPVMIGIYEQVLDDLWLIEGHTIEERRMAHEKLEHNLLIDKLFENIETLKEEFENESEQHKVTVGLIVVLLVFMGFVVASNLLLAGFVVFYLYRLH